MIETVRSALLERGLERGCRFMVTANLLDDMRVHLLFNRLCRHPQRVFDRQRRARAMRDDTNPVDAEKRAAAVFFVIRLVLNGSNGIPREECADFSHPCTHQLVLEPLKHRHRDRFARFQDNVAYESVAYDNFNRVFKKMTPFNVANEVKRTWFQHLKYFLGQFGALNILVAERDKANGRILVMQNMPGINRAHERILKKMFWARIDIRACVDQNENVRLGWKHGCNARSIDSWQRAKLNRARGDGCACVSRAHYRVRITALHQIDSTADRRIFLSPNSSPGAIAHFNHLSGMHNLDTRIVALVFAQLVFDLGRLFHQLELPDLVIIE